MPFAFAVALISVACADAGTSSTAGPLPDRLVSLHVDIEIPEILRGTNIETDTTSTTVHDRSFQQVEASCCIDCEFTVESMIILNDKVQSPVATLVESFNPHNCYRHHIQDSLTNIQLTLCFAMVAVICLGIGFEKSARRQLTRWMEENDWQEVRNFEVLTQLLPPNA